MSFASVTTFFDAADTLRLVLASEPSADLSVALCRLHVSCSRWRVSVQTELMVINATECSPYAVDGLAHLGVSCRRLLCGREASSCSQSDVSFAS